MFVVAVPLFLIIIVLLFFGAGLLEALQINIMPVVSILVALFGVISLIRVFRSEEEKRMPAIICCIICAVIFLFTLGTSVSTGDILSWLWYHISNAHFLR